MVQWGSGADPHRSRGPGRSVQSALAAGEPVAARLHHHVAAGSSLHGDAFGGWEDVKRRQSVRRRGQGDTEAWSSDSLVGTWTWVDVLTSTVNGKGRRNLVGHVFGSVVARDLEGSRGVAEDLCVDGVGFAEGPAQSGAGRLPYVGSGSVWAEDFSGAATVSAALTPPRRVRESQYGLPTEKTYHFPIWKMNAMLSIMESEVIKCPPPKEEALLALAAKGEVEREPRKSFALPTVTPHSIRCGCFTC